MASSSHVGMILTLWIIYTGADAGRLERIENSIASLDLKLRAYSTDISILKDDMADTSRKLDLILERMNDSDTKRKHINEVDKNVATKLDLSYLNNIKAVVQSEVHRIRRSFVTEKQRLMMQQTEYKMQFQEYAEKLDNAVIKVNERHQTKWAVMERSVNESINSVLDSICNKIDDQIIAWNESVHGTLSNIKDNTIAFSNHLDSTITAWIENVDDSLTDIDNNILRSINNSDIAHHKRLETMNSRFNIFLNQTKNAIDKLKYDDEFNVIVEKINEFERKSFNIFHEVFGVRPNIRLVSSLRSSGRLEVFINGTWGTVCDDDFLDDDATVACRMLGFNTGTYKSESYFGRGSGLILMDDVLCDGTERNLFECDYKKTHNCNHDEDVGVICSY